MNLRRLALIASLEIVATVSATPLHLGPELDRQPKTEPAIFGKKQFTNYRNMGTITFGRSGCSIVVASPAPPQTLPAYAFTAAHCIDGVDRQGVLTLGGKRFPITCSGHPSYFQRATASASTDLAMCFIPQASRQAIAEIIGNERACLAVNDFTKAGGRSLSVTGWGFPDPQKQQTAEHQFNSIRRNPPYGDAYYFDRNIAYFGSGDSGGPLWTALKDGTRVVHSSVSGAIGKVGGHWEYDTAGSWTSKLARDFLTTFTNKYRDEGASFCTADSSSGESGPSPQPRNPPNPSTGAKIAEVWTEGPAYRAGVKAGSHLLELNGVPVSSFEDVRKVLDQLLSAKQAAHVILTVQQDGATRHIAIPVAEIRTAGTLGIRIEMPGSGPPSPPAPPAPSTEKAQICEGRLHQAQCPAHRRWPFSALGAPPATAFGSVQGEDHSITCQHSFSLYGTEFAKAHPSDGSQRGMLRVTYEQTRSTLKQALAEQTHWPTSVRSQMERTLDNIRLVEDRDPFYQSFCGPNGMSTAAYSAGRIVFCPALIRFMEARAKEAGTDPIDAIFFVLAHELGHSIGYNTSAFSSAFSKMNECYRGRYGNAQMSENSADAFAALAIARRAQSSGRNPFQVVNGAAQPFCNRVADTAHASGQFRIDRNLVQSPEVQKLFGCSGQAVCGLAGEVTP